MRRPSAVGIKDASILRDSQGARGFGRILP